MNSSTLNSFQSLWTSLYICTYKHSAVVRGVYLILDGYPTVRVHVCVCVPCNRAEAAIPAFQRSLDGPAHLQLETEMGMVALRKKFL